MKQLLTFLLLTVFALSVAAQGTIVSITVDPPNPSDHDTVLVIVNSSFTSGDCPLDYKSHSITEYTILATSHHCLGMLAVICNAVDTFEVGPLAAGTYKFDLTLTSGGLPIPCTPGIVIDDQDSTFFTVTSTTGIGDITHGELDFTNPVLGTLHFGAPLPERAYIYSVAGTLVRTIEAGETEADVSALSRGLYVLRMNTVAARLIIQ